MDVHAAKQQKVRGGLSGLSERRVCAVQLSGLRDVWL